MVCDDKIESHPFAPRSTRHHLQGALRRLGPPRHRRTPRPCPRRSWVRCRRRRTRRARCCVAIVLGQRAAAARCSNRRTAAAVWRRASPDGPNAGGGGVDALGGAAEREAPGLHCGGQSGLALLWSSQVRRSQACGHLEPWVASPAAAGTPRCWHRVAHVQHCNCCCCLLWLTMACYYCAATVLPLTSRT